jgi:predicted transcriptional regulator
LAAKDSGFMQNLGDMLTLARIARETADLHGSPAAAELAQDRSADEPDYAWLAGSIVASYAAHNAISPSDLGGLIEQVYATLVLLGRTLQANAPRTPATSSVVSFRKLQIPATSPDAVFFGPAVPVEKSVTRDHIICLEDGKRLKTLKRHLQTKYGLTLEQYRAKWGLPPEYPSVAPSYAASRSAIAKAKGLGKWKRKLQRGWSKNGGRATGA